MPSHHEIRVRRVYDEPDRAHAGARILVDRLWPRGVAKVDVAPEEWLKDVAPSTELRRWYGHEVEKFDEFERRYRAELRRQPASAAVEHLLDLAGHRRVTLLTATRDVPHSGAAVLLEHLER